MTTKDTRVTTLEQDSPSTDSSSLVELQLGPVSAQSHQTPVPFLATARQTKVVSDTGHISRTKNASGWSRLGQTLVPALSDLMYVQGRAAMGIQSKVLYLVISKREVM